jgi:membrane fusion protein, heavy metal efflux system
MSPRKTMSTTKQQFSSRSITSSNVASLAFAFFATAAAYSCGEAKTDAAEGSTTVTTQSTGVLFSADQVTHGGVRWTAAEASTMAATIELPGRLTANEDQTARLGAPAQGRLIRVHVQAGDRVSRGQRLVTLQSAAAGTARADYAKAVAELNSRRAAANYSHGALQRAERLLEAKAIARQELERARADDELAQSAQAQAAAEVDRARSALAQFGTTAATGEMTLQSPVSGIVLTRDAVPGSVVDAGTPLVTVSDITTLWLEVAATDQVAARLRPGLAARFTVPAFPAEQFAARVQSIGGALDPTTRTLRVRALVPNASGRLRPEMFTTVLIDGGVPVAGIAVPDSALQMLDEKPVLFVAIPDGKGGARFQRRDVAVGGKVGGRVQILSGVAAGELVVVQGAFAIKSEFARSQMPAG